MAASLRSSLSFFLERQGVAGTPLPSPSLQEIIDNFPRSVFCNFLSEEGSLYGDITDWIYIGPRVIGVVVESLEKIQERAMNAEHLRLAIEDLQAVANVFVFAEPEYGIEAIEKLRSDPQQDEIETACKVAQFFRSFSIAGDGVLSRAS